MQGETTGRVLLVDGDIFAYQIAAAAEIPTNWGDDLWTLHADAREARFFLDRRISDVKECLAADDVIVCLTHRINFRKEIYPLYKANRAKTRKPMLLHELREYLTGAYTTYLQEGLEADDCLGILATGERIAGEKIIVSIDKDLRSIPGLHYEANNPDKGIFSVTVEQADRWHMRQTLTGDATDGYHGCPG